MITGDNSSKDFGNPINVLKHGNSKQIDTEFFIPLFKHLNKARLDNDVVTERIDTTDIPHDTKNIGRMTIEIGKIWEEFIQTEIRKFVVTNQHLKYFDNYQDQKKFIPRSNGSFLIKENNKLIAEFDSVLSYRNQHHIIVEIKSSTGKGSGTAFGSGHYQSKMKIVKKIFLDYDEPFFLKIRASEDSRNVGLVSRFKDHRKMAINDSPMLTDLKHKLGKAKFNAQKLTKSNN